MSDMRTYEDGVRDALAAIDACEDGHNALVIAGLSDAYDAVEALLSDTPTVPDDGSEVEPVATEATPKAVVRMQGRVVSAGTDAAPAAVPVERLRALASKWLRMWEGGAPRAAAKCASELIEETERNAKEGDDA